MALTVSEVERLFSLLLSPDTEIIRQVHVMSCLTPQLHVLIPSYDISLCLLSIFPFQATTELRGLYKNPNLLGVLCHVMLHSENPH